MSDKKSNPWPGVMSYQIPGNAENDYKFCGRGGTIEAFLSRVEAYGLTTLYGKSGVGKTSFLNAGVFPILQNENYIPIYIRLGLKHIQDKRSFCQLIVDSITEGMDTYSLLETDWQDEKESNQVDYLWRYFHTHRFKELDSNGKYKTPVIILDQFEEVFNYGEKSVSLLLKQIYELLSDNLCVPSGIGWFEDTTCRFVISIREDFLFYLEDYIDKYDLPILKENRFRLRPLSKSKAMEVVLVPGSNYIEETQKDQVAERIVQASLQNDGEVNSMMLSMICYRLYEKLNAGGKITLEMAESVDSSIQDYYKDAISGLPENERQFIENYLVRDEHRRRVEYVDFIANVPHGEYLFGNERKPDFSEAEYSVGRYYKLLTRIGVGNKENNCEVEIVHDQFAKVVAAVKKELSIEKAKAKRDYIIEQIIKIGMLSLAFVILGITMVLSMHPKNITINDCIEKNKNIDTIRAYRGTDCEDDSISLENVYVCPLAFSKNRYLKTLRVGSNTHLCWKSFHSCPNLQKVIFDGNNISCSDYAITGDKLYEVEITKQAFFNCFGKMYFRNLKKISVAEGHQQCELDLCEESVLIITDTTAVVLSQSDAAPLPVSWKKYVASSEVLHGLWCDTISLQALIDRGYDEREYWILVDTIRYMPKLKEVNKNLFKNVLYAELPNIDSIRNDMFNKSNIRIFKAPNAIKVGDYAFSRCGKLFRINLQNVKSLGKNAFDNCCSLKEVQFPNLRDVGSGALSLNAKISQIDISNVERLCDNVFGGDTISKLELYHVKSISKRTFRNCVIDSLYLLKSQSDKIGDKLFTFFCQANPGINDTVDLYLHHEAKRDHYLVSEFNVPQNKEEDYIGVLLLEGDTLNYEFRQNNYLERISCAKRNKKYFQVNNMLYKRGNSCPVLIAQNVKTILLPNSIKSSTLYVDLSQKRQVESVVLLDKTNFEHLKLKRLKQKIIIYFPFGSKRYIESVGDIQENLVLCEMSRIQTLWYRCKGDLWPEVYSHPQRLLFVVLISILGGLVPIIRNRVLKKFKPIFCYAITYFTLFYIGGGVIVSTFPILDNNVYTKIVYTLWLIWWYIMAERLATLIACKIHSREMVLKELYVLGIISLVTFIFLPREAQVSFSFTDVSKIVIIVILLVYIYISKINSIQDNKVIEMYKIRRILYILLTSYLIADGFGVICMHLLKADFYSTDSLVLGVILLLISCAWGVTHLVIDKKYGFSYKIYKNNRHLYEGNQVAFLSDSMTKRRLHIFASCFAVMFAMLLIGNRTWRLVFELYNAHENYIFGFIPVNQIVDFYGKWSHMLLYDSCLLIVLTLVCGDIILRRKHIKYIDIVKQYMVEGEQMQTHLSIMSKNQKHDNEECEA